MARLVRIQFDPNSTRFPNETKIYIFVKSGTSDYTYVDTNNISSVSAERAAFYVPLPAPPHEQNGFPYNNFGVDIAVRLNVNQYQYFSATIDAINVVDTELTPDTGDASTSSISTVYMDSMRTTTVEQLTASPSIVNGYYIHDNGQYYSGRYYHGYNITYNELSSMPVIADPGRAWVDPSSLVSYSISNSLIGCTTDNEVETVSEGSSYSATITASTGYHFESEDVSITMGGDAITPTFAADNKSFTISIPSVTSSVSISATATYDTPVSTYYTITNELTQCTTNNAATQVPEGSSYSAKLTANAGYYFYTGNVVITMGSTTITPTLNKNGSYNVSIAEVTGNVVITALASADAPTPSVWSASWEEIPTPNSAYDVVSSSIHQTADKIELKVSSADLVSTLNSQLTIQSNLIHLYSDGKIVIEGENFNLDADGYLTAVGATLENADIITKDDNNFGVRINDGKIGFTYSNTEGAAIAYRGSPGSATLEVGITSTTNSAYARFSSYNGLASFSGSGGTLLGDSDSETTIFGEIYIQNPNDGSTQSLGYVEADLYDEVGAIDGLTWDVDPNTGYVYNLQITSRHSFYY